MITTQDPVPDEAALAAYINGTETDKIEFIQVAALDTQNQFDFSQSADSTAKTPVAAKIALATAGAIAAVPGSPIPPQRLPGVGEM